MFTGNRGCLVDDAGEFVRHHDSSLWITCLTEFRSRRFPLAEPRQWTPIFFLDDAVALSAGHRPCGLCRPDAYRSYRDAVTRARKGTKPLVATQINRLLASERHRHGRGLHRAGDRRLWTASIDELPTGTVIVDHHGAHAWCWRIGWRCSPSTGGRHRWTAPRAVMRRC